MSWTIKHLKPADYRVMPWKNGGGATTEIACEGLAGEDFAWRVSMADLTSSGPFSVFRGVDRIITPIAGPAFRLTHAGRGSHVVTPFVPYAFSGDWESTAELEGSGKDYNVMIRREAGSAWTEVLTTACRRTYRKGVVVLTALGTARVTLGADVYSLRPFETLLARVPGAVQVRPEGPIIVSAINA